MLRSVLPCVLASFLALTLVCAPVCAAESTAPKKIAYLEKGHFWLFEATRKAFQEAMLEKGGNVSYPEALYASPGWDADTAALRQEARRLLESDADLILAAGTAAVRALLDENKGQKPILGIALADPMAAGLMKTPEDSGVDNFSCEVIIDRWKNMYRVFYDIIHFRRLGIMYPAGPDGRVYAAVDDATAISHERGFEVVEAIIPDESEASCRKGIDELHAKGADAFFIGPLNCFDWSVTDPTPLLRRIHGYGMPTFARDGSQFVQGGALMGFATWDISPTGRKLADAALQVFSGVSPRSLRLTDTAEPIIALNLQTARELGIDLPFDVLVAADEIYENTEKPRMN